MVMQRLVGLAVVVLGAVALAACSEEAPTDFTADNRSGFLAACSQPLEDSRLIGEICQCVFDETQSAMPFSEFSSIDSRLTENTEQAIPSEITQIIADCVFEEADL